MTKKIQSGERLSYLDNLKALMIIFVIIIHAAVTYSGIGSWYYIEHPTLDNVSFYSFLLIQTFNQAYFMSLFFMISAYFIPSSLERKGTRQFIKDRLFRLGIPTLFYIFLLNPIVAKISHPNINLIEFYQHGITSFKFISWTGPMWFALTLLIFSFIYLLIRPGFTKLMSKYPFAVNTKNVLMLIFLITVTAFGIRLVFPIGTSVINLQFCFFAAYIFMFLSGIIAYQKNIFNTITYAKGKKWFITAFVIGVPLWVVIVYFGINKNNLSNAPVIGGWNLLAFGYAFWESFFCVTIIIGLLGIFKHFFNTQNPLQKFLSTNAFGVYVFHPLILVSISVLLKNWHLFPILKFIIVFSLAIPVTFIFVALIRKIKVLQMIFS